MRYFRVICYILGTGVGLLHCYTSPVRPVRAIEGLHATGSVAVSYLDDSRSFATSHGIFASPQVSGGYGFPGTGLVTGLRTPVNLFLATWDTYWNFLDTSWFRAGLGVEIAYFLPGSYFLLGVPIGHDEIGIGGRFNTIWWSEDSLVGIRKPAYYAGWLQYFHRWNDQFLAGIALEYQYATPIDPIVDDETGGFPFFELETRHSYILRLSAQMDLELFR